MPPLAMIDQKTLAGAYSRNKALVEYGERDNRQLGKRLAGITKAYPNLNTATAVTLAEAGYGADSVEVKAVGELQVKRNRERTGFSSRFSNPIDDDNDRTGIRSVARTALTGLGAGIEMVEAGVRGRIQEIRDGDGPDMPSGIGEVVGYQPFVDMFQGDNKQFNQTRIGAAVQVARETPGVSVPEALNNNPQIGRDGDVTGLLDRPQQTWFSGPNSLAEKQQVRNARAVGLYRDAANPKGRAITEGRAVTNVIGMEPGRATWEMMSSLLKMSNSPWFDEDEDIDKQLGRIRTGIETGVDATFGVVADPLLALSKARQAAVIGKGQFGGRTTAVEVPQYTRTTAKVTDKATRQVSDVPIVLDNGTRRTVVPENAVNFIRGSKKGRKVNEYLAKEDDYERLAAVLGKGTHPSTVLKVLNETDPVRMEAVLLEEVGKGFIDTAPNVRAADFAAQGMPVLGGKIAATASARSYRSKARLRELAPSETIMYKSDPAWAVEQYRRMARSIGSGERNPAVLAAENAKRRAWNANNPDKPQRPMAQDPGPLIEGGALSKNIESFARSIVDEEADWSQPYIALMDLVGMRMQAQGMPAEFANSVSRIFMDNVTEQRKFWVDANGQPKHPFLTRDGVDDPVPSASLYAEMVTDGLPVIDVEKLNRALSSTAKLLENENWRSVVATGDFITSFFKFMVLPTRGGAFAMRNVAEAQARMAVEGFANIYTSPWQAMAWRMGDNPDSDFSRLLGRTDRQEGRGWADPSGQDFRFRAEMEGNASQFAKTQETKGGPYNDERILFMPGYPTVKKGDTGHLEGVRFELNKLASSPEARMVLQAKSPEHARNLFWRSDARKVIAKKHPEVETRAGSDRWIDEVTTVRIREATNMRPELIEAILKGRIGRQPLMSRDARGAMVPNPAATKELAKYIDDLPEFVVTPASITVGAPANPIAQFADIVERRLFTAAFSAFGSVPMNRFVNSPIMREATWDAAVRLAPLGTAAARKQLIVNARKSNMPKSVIRQLQAATGPAGTLDVKELTDLAYVKGFNRWLDIVYTSHKKGNWTRSVRMLNAFAAAQADSIKFWSKRLAKNPLVIHRVEQGMRAGRQSGTFYTDENGEERFQYPASRALMAIPGVEAVMSGATRSANLIVAGTQMGYGPVVSWGTAWFAPDSKEWDGFRKFINPYGAPDDEGGIFEGFSPRHIQRIMAALGRGSPEQKRLYEEALADVQAYLKSTGDYGDTPEDMQRLRKDAKAKGKMMWLIQAFASAAVPVAPKGETQFKDPSGRIYSIALIAADYRKMLNKDFETASQRLLEKYGDAVFYAVGGGTDGSALTTEEAYDLARDNPEVVEDFGAVWSFFTDPDSPFSYEELKRQLDNPSERVTLNLRDRQVAAQTRIANTQYWQYKDQFGPFPTPDEKGYLAQVKAEIKKDYPLWDDQFNANARKTAIEQVQAAVKHPVFKGTPAAAAAERYLAARKEVADYYNGIKVTRSDSGWGKAKAAEDGRDYMRSVAERLLKETPEFRTLWERVFRGEMVDDVEGAP